MRIVDRFRRPESGRTSMRSGLLRLLAAASVGAAAVVPASGGATAAPPDDNGQLPGGWVATQWGPMSPAGRALLQNVRLANLWEGEGAAVLGMQKGTTEEVRSAAKVLNEGHAQLELELRDVAARLQVDLPAEPNADQQTWLGEMRAASGTAFDEVWVDRLRAAHGKVFSLIATVRANTRNALVRDYAEKANDAVALHMTVLEATGLVAYNALPTPAAPQAKAAGVGGQPARGGSIINPASSGVNPAVIWLVLIGSLVAGSVVTARIWRSGDRSTGPTSGQ